MACRAGVHVDAANAIVVVGDAVVSGQGLGVAAVGVYEVYKHERKSDKTKIWRDKSGSKQIRKGQLDGSAHRPNFTVINKAIWRRQNARSSCC